MTRESPALPEPVEPGAGPLELAQGGFTADTEIMTSDGPVSIRELTAGDRVYALDPWTRVMKRKSITEAETRKYCGELVAIETRRANLRVAPDHRIIYRTETVARPRIRRAGDLPDQLMYRFINEWTRPTRSRLESVDITDFMSDYQACAVSEDHGHTFRAALPEGCTPCRNNSHTGYFFDSRTFKAYQHELESLADEITVQAAPGHTRRPYRFDGDDFLRFLAWFVTEGSLYEKENRRTISVKIAQEIPENRVAIRELFERMGIDVRECDRCYEFGSFLYGRLLKRLCGKGCRSKRLPDFVSDLPREQQSLLLEVLMDGDGNDNGVYYTTSDLLAGSVLQLCLDLGIKPAYSRRGDIWRISLSVVNDGFSSRKHVSRVLYAGDLCTIAVEDYPIVMAGRNGKFQWTSVSRLS